MLNTSAGWYFGSRAIAAAGNLLAVAIFTRLAGPAEYGQYLVIFAWSLIVFGFSTQWIAISYFGVYQTRRLNEYVASLGQLVVVALAAIAVILGVVALIGPYSPKFLLALFALVCGSTVHEAAFEVTRTLQKARAASLSMILRTVLIVTLGSASLLAGGSATSLALAIAIAHLVAAVPCILTFTFVRPWHKSRAASLHLIRYGWPLLLSFGVMAVGQTVDRLVLAHYFGTTELGYYGVIADVLRQGFFVCGEVITLSLVTVAKQLANDRDIAASNRAMRKAFNACVAAATFGAAFFFVFGNHIVALLFGAAYVAPASDLIPILAVAFAFMLMRNFYFAQVIYFTHASYLELVVSVLFVIVSAVLSVLLIPVYGPQGAALSLMSAAVVSCFTFALIGRRHYRLPIDLAGLWEIPVLAGLFVLFAYATARLGAGTFVALTLDFIVFALLGLLVVYRHGLLRAVRATGHSEKVPQPELLRAARNQIPAE